MMTTATAKKIGLNPTRYYPEDLRSAYYLLVALPDSEYDATVIAAVANLETALRRIGA